MDLIETYNNMRAEAAGQEKVASEQEQEVDERMEVFAKYASWAEGALQEEFGDDYTAEDVEKLATMKLEEDAEEQMNREKVAEYFDAGQIMYEGFKAAAQADQQ